MTYQCLKLMTIVSSNSGEEGYIPRTPLVVVLGIQLCFLRQSVVKKCERVRVPFTNGAHFVLPKYTYGTIYYVHHRVSACLGADVM